LSPDTTFISLHVGQPLRSNYSNFKDWGALMIKADVEKLRAAFKTADAE
jgi:hypothetical protein